MCTMFRFHDECQPLRVAPPTRHDALTEWHTIPDLATAATALRSGEVNWWEQPTEDLPPLVREHADATVDIIDTPGYQAAQRFNLLLPKWSNVAVRRTLPGAFSQTDMMQAMAGHDPSIWRAGRGFFRANGAWPEGLPPMRQ